MQEQIGALKEGLVVERKKRYNKEIYEEACKDINKHPPHKSTKVLKSTAVETKKKQANRPPCAPHVPEKRRCPHETPGGR